MPEILSALASALVTSIKYNLKFRNVAGHCLCNKKQPTLFGKIKDQGNYTFISFIIKANWPTFGIKERKHKVY